jgi:hypothetical protein
MDAKGGEGLSPRATLVFVHPFNDVREEVAAARTFLRFLCDRLELLGALGNCISEPRFQKLFEECLQAATSGACCVVLRCAGEAGHGPLPMFKDPTLRNTGSLDHIANPVFDQESGFFRNCAVVFSTFCWGIAACACSAVRSLVARIFV